MARRQLKFFADNSIFKPNMFFVELAKTDRKIFKRFLFSKKIEKNVWKLKNSISGQKFRLSPSQRNQSVE